jgi:hypothetical protein
VTQLFTDDDFREIYVVNLLIGQEVKLKGLDNICTVDASAEMTGKDNRVECLATNMYNKAMGEPGSIRGLYSEYGKYSGESRKFHLDYVVFPDVYLAENAMDIIKTRKLDNIVAYDGFAGRLMAGGDEVMPVDGKFQVVEMPDLIEIVGIDKKGIKAGLKKSIGEARPGSVVGPIQAGDHHLIYRITEIRGKEALTYDAFAKELNDSKVSFLGNVILKKLWNAGVSEYKGKPGKLGNALRME